MKAVEMFKLFNELDDIDKRGFFEFMSGRLGTAFESYFQEYLDLADEAKVAEE